MHEYYGDENVLNTLTLKTEGTKSTVLVCAKGFGINNDEAQFLADLIPFERGANWTLNDCFNGFCNPLKLLILIKNYLPWYKKFYIDGS